MKKNNFSSLLKQDMVNRFEDTVKEEIRQFHSKSQETDVFIKDLYDKTSVLKMQVRELKEHCDNTKISITQEYITEKSILRAEFESQRLALKDGCKKLDQELNKVHEEKALLAKKESLDQFKEEMQLSLKCFNENINMIFRGFEDRLKILESNWDQRFFLHVASIDKIVKGFEKDIGETVDGFESFKIDTVSLLKELQIYKKNVFILEKKIEDLYTQIDRIRGTL